VDKIEKSFFFENKDKEDGKETSPITRENELKSFNKFKEIYGKWVAGSQKVLLV
jgi:hypothetical protein